jgi:diguanylate cyclase (GGDEF)-like protein
LTRRLDQWRRNRTPLSLLLLDVDRFKQFNDQFGHQAGDQVLKKVASVLIEDLREMDFAARYGGEEFAVLLPDTELGDASQVAERLRWAVAGASCLVGDENLQATVSIGVTTTVGEDTPQAIVARADAALYAAKRAGRNRTHLHDGQELQPVRNRPSVARHRLEKIVTIAPYHNAIPDGADFLPYECRDLSTGGLSFLSDKLPTASMLVVEMEEPHGAHYVLARVVSVRNDGTAEQPQYRVGCSFQGKLVESPALDSPCTPSPLHPTGVPGIS